MQFAHICVGTHVLYTDTCWFVLVWFFSINFYLVGFFSYPFPL